MFDDVSVTFRDFLNKSAKEIDQAIVYFFTEWNKEVEHVAPRIAKYTRQFEEAVSGGKRIRGALIMLGYGLAAQKYNPELLKIAAAYEIFQTAILAHDDIIDNSSQRRGKPSLHKALGGDHFAISQAICLGDMAFFLAYRLIAESDFNEKQKIKAMAFYSKSITETVIGEMLDVELAHNPQAVNEKGVLAVSRLKTAYYTFVAPLSLGAILAGAEEEELSLLQVYGQNAGIAFQIQDDIKDVFGTAKLLKKQPAGDILEGKKTLLYLKAKEKANKSQAAILEKYYGNNTSGNEEIAELRRIFEETGARNYAERLSSEHAENALAVIPKITNAPRMQTMLREIIEYIQKT